MSWSDYYFTGDNNAREVPEGSFRVWAYGESVIVPSLDMVGRAVTRAQAWCHEVQVQDSSGDPVPLTADTVGRSFESFSVERRLREIYRDEFNRKDMEIIGGP